MNLKKAKVTIDKINALYRSLSATDNTVSSIERDLMLTYVRQLYEIVLEDPSPSAFDGQADPIKKSSGPEFEIVPPKPKRENFPPKIIDIEETQVEPPKPQPKTPRTPPSPPPAPVKREPAPEPPTPPVRRSSPKPAYGNIDKLLEQKKATELSEKLSERPISDLTRAMSINDRLLYMNELFGKDLDALNGSLSLLNKYENIEEAKGLLANLADQYKWMEEEKIDFARAFIKLVRRRYKQH